MKKGDVYGLKDDWTARVRKVWPKRLWRKEAKVEVWISPPNPDFLDPRISVIVGPLDKVKAWVESQATSKESANDQAR